MTMARLRWYALTTVGGLFIAYQLLADAMSPDGVSRCGLVGPSSVIPMYAVGAWLTWRLPDPSASGSVTRRGTAHVGVRSGRSWQPATVDQLAVVPGAQRAESRSGSGGGAGYGAADRELSRRLRRTELAAADAAIFVGHSSGSPLALLASPVVLVSSWVTEAIFPNPYAVNWLAWLAEPAVSLALNSEWVIFVGVVVLCARFVAADAAGRVQMRVIFIAIRRTAALRRRFITSALGAPEYSALVVTLLTLGSLTGILLPAAIIYGILRHRLFELDLVVRKSVAYGAAFLLIAAAYAVIAATPGLMLGNRVPVTLAVIVTIAAALAFQPLRRRLESAVSRRLFGDRVRQYQLLTNLGTTMEQTAELDELLPGSRTRSKTESVRVGCRSGCGMRMAAGWTSRSVSPAR